MDFFTTNGNLENMSKLENEEDLYRYITEVIA